MPHYTFPIFIDVSHQIPLVIGESPLAVAKVRTLLTRAKKIDLIASKMPKALEKFAKQGMVRLGRFPLRRDCASGWLRRLKNRPLIVICPKEKDLIKLLHPICLARGLPMNVADHKAFSSFNFGAIVDRRPVTIAIGTEGISPMLAVDLRQKLEQVLGLHIGLLAKMAERYRARVNKILPMGLRRRVFWQQFLKGTIARLIEAREFAKIDDAVNGLLLQLLKSEQPSLSYYNRLSVFVAPRGSVEFMPLSMLHALKNADIILVMPLGKEKTYGNNLAINQLATAGDYFVGHSWQRDDSHIPISEVLAFARREVEIVEFGNQEEKAVTINGKKVFCDSHLMFNEHSFYGSDLLQAWEIGMIKKWLKQGKSLVLLLPNEVGYGQLLQQLKLAHINFRALNLEYLEFQHDDDSEKTQPTAEDELADITTTAKESEYSGAVDAGIDLLEVSSQTAVLEQSLVNNQMTEDSIHWPGEGLPLNQAEETFTQHRAKKNVKLVEPTNPTSKQLASSMNRHKKKYH